LPLYEYRCTDCGYSFEKIQNFSAKPETVCPKCQGFLIRPVTAPALRFEGAGWYVNDYAGKGAAKSGDSTTTAKDNKPETKSDSTSASGESKASPAPATPAATPATSTATTAGS
jgi:putative FmdB family regulatory protein